VTGLTNKQDNLLIYKVFLFTNRSENRIDTKSIGLARAAGGMLLRRRAVLSATHFPIMGLSNHTISYKWPKPLIYMIFF
jgi:hypothetical protein